MHKLPEFGDLAIEHEIAEFKNRPIFFARIVAIGYCILKYVIAFKLYATRLCGRGKRYQVRRTELLILEQ